MTFRRVVTAILFAVGGYIAAAVVTFVLVSQFSPNAHDRSIEAAMTAAFVGGPLGGLVGLIAGFIHRR